MGIRLCESQRIWGMGVERGDGWEVHARMRGLGVVGGRMGDRNEVAWCRVWLSVSGYGVSRGSLRWEQHGIKLLLQSSRVAMPSTTEKGNPCPTPRGPCESNSCACKFDSVCEPDPLCRHLKEVVLSFLVPHWENCLLGSTLNYICNALGTMNWTDIIELLIPGEWFCTDLIWGC